MKCNKCGKDNIEGSRYCKFCGTELIRVREQQNNNSVMWNGAEETKTDVLTKGCKVWFWFVMIVNVLSALSGLALISVAPFLGIVTVASGIAVTAGAGMIILKYKKVGLYIIIGAAVINCFINIMNSAGILVSVISAVLCPAISYYFVSKNAKVIQ